MSSWDPNGYLRFADERTRPAADLAARIALADPASVIDLGCGPGNSTQVLRERWPGARVTGLDSAAEMIDSARSTFPAAEWLLGDIAAWSADGNYDVVFSNAALQWVPDHGPLIGRLFAAVAPGGALAFQIPSTQFALVRSLIHEIAVEGPWATRMSGPLGALTMEPPEFYYDRLAPLARSLDIWETEYVHRLDSPQAVVEWIASTGLRPFLEVLDEPEAASFKGELVNRAEAAYPRRVDGRVLFPFRRTFVIAYKES